MTERTDGSPVLLTRLVVIGDREYEKPWDPACQACRSPWMAGIDAALAEGRSLKFIRKLMAGRHPAVPNEAVLRAHIAHLAEPHLQARMSFEEAAAERGDSTDISSATAQDALAALIRRGSAQLANSEMDVAARDLIAAIRLQAQIERERGGEGLEASAWQAALMEFFEIVRRHLSAAQWKAFTGEAYASPAIRAVIAGSQKELTG